jgi:hypothetical protein
MADRPDEFSPQVKREVAASAGHHCSMPDCWAPTSGPSDSQASGEAKAGVAAHIAAASPRGPRYDPDQSPDERRSRDNAIWLCDTDARRIDTDAGRFSPDLLRAWRTAAEDRARAELGRPRSSPSVRSRRLVPFAVTIPSPDQVGPLLEAFLIDIGAPRSWGTLFHAARMLLHELALNAFEHGGAEKVGVSSTEDSVSLRAGGDGYPLRRLRASGRGGRQALIDFEADAVGSFVLQASREGQENAWTLVDEVLTLGANTPCGFALSQPRSAAASTAAARIEELAGCEEIHFYPEPHWSYSDWFRILGAAEDLLGDRVMIVHGVGEDSRVARAIATRHPQIRFTD